MSRSLSSIPIRSRPRLRPFHIAPKTRRNGVASLSSSGSARTLARVGSVALFGAGLSTSAYLFYLLNSEPSQELSPFHWSSVTVESSVPSPSDPASKIITLRIPNSLVSSNSTQSPSLEDHPPVYSFYFKNSDIQVERPYTPLFGITGPGSEATAKSPNHTSSSPTGEDAHFASFWIKKYDHGEVGRWLHSKRAGEALDIRGPAVTLDFEAEMKKGQFDEVVMVRVSFSSHRKMLEVSQERFTDEWIGQ